MKTGINVINVHKIVWDVKIPLHVNNVIKTMFWMIISVFNKENVLLENLKIKKKECVWNAKKDVKNAKTKKIASNVNRTILKIKKINLAKKAALLSFLGIKNLEHVKVV